MNREKSGHLGGAAEDEVPKCGEELIEVMNLLGLEVKSCFEQVVVTTGKVAMSLPLAR